MTESVWMRLVVTSSLACGLRPSVTVP